MLENDTPSAMLKAIARHLVVRNSPKIFFVSALFVALITVVSEFQFRLSGLSEAYSLYIEQVAAGAFHSLERFFEHISLFRLLIVFLFLLLGVILRVGFMSYCLNITRDVRSSAFDVLDGFLLIGKIVSIALICFVKMLLWSLLFFAPGIIAFYRYRQAFYILIDDPKTDIMQCINRSKLLMNGNKLDLFLTDVSFFGWFLLSFLSAILLQLAFPFSLPLISIWVRPYIGLSHSKFYDNLLSKVTA